MTQPSPLYLLIEERLGAKLAEYVAERRRDGKAWRRIALEIWSETQVDVTYETLRAWFGDDPGTAAAPADASAGAR